MPVESRRKRWAESLSLKLADPLTDQCDYTTHPCTRCRRLNIECVGVGQRRFKFVHDERASHSSDDSFSKSKSPRRGSNTPLILLSRNPSDDVTGLVGAFTDKIKPSIGIKYNLAWTYGDYLNYIPTRIGRNEALDAATDAFLTALQTFSTGVDNSPAVLEKYGAALGTLRKCLDNPVKARMPETLCAILFLWNSQVGNHRLYGLQDHALILVCNSNSSGDQMDCHQAIQRVLLRLFGSEDVPRSLLILSKPTCCCLCELWW
jgi:hypothetical protein